MNSSSNESFKNNIDVARQNNYYDELFDFAHAYNRLIGIKCSKTETGLLFSNFPTCHRQHESHNQNFATNKVQF
jgi:hypothetical protein